MLSSKLTVAVHVCALLSLHAEDPLTSEYIAGSVNTNPVVVRRILGALRDAGYVSSRGGPGGGWQLAIDPAGTTLLDLLNAVEPEQDAIALHRNDPNPHCVVGRNIRAALGTVYEKARKSRDEQLNKVSLAQIVSTIQARQRGTDERIKAVRGIKGSL